MERENAELVWGRGRETEKRGPRRRRAVAPSEGEEQGHGGQRRWGTGLALVASFQELKSRSELLSSRPQTPASAHAARAREEGVSEPRPGALLLGCVRLRGRLPWLPAGASGVGGWPRPDRSGAEGQARPRCRNGDRAPAVLLSNSAPFRNESDPRPSRFPQPREKNFLATLGC